MKAVCIVLAALALSQVVAAQTPPYFSTLFQTFNATSQKIGFLQCNETRPIVGVTPGPTTNDGSPLTQITPDQAGQVVVDAVWFGGAVGPASNFQVVGNCSALQLTSNGGHGTTVFTGPVPGAPAGCSVNWYQSPNYLHVFTQITNTGFAWSISLPTVTSVRAQSACNGGYQYCPLATGAGCDSLLNLPTTLNPDGSKVSAPAPAPAPMPEDAAAAEPAAKTTPTQPTAILG